MNMDSVNIAGGLIILVTGLVAVLVSITRIKLKTFTILNLGIFFSLYGLL